MFAGRRFTGTHILGTRKATSASILSSADMRYLGYNVTYVQNITDVGHLTDDADQGEDKIAKAAAKVHKHQMAAGGVVHAELF